LYGVIQEVETNNQELQIHIQQLQKQLRKANTKVTKLSKQHLKHNNSDLSDYVLALQTANDDQTHQIELLKSEKELLKSENTSLITHTETQFKELQKKNIYLERMLEDQLKPEQSKLKAPHASLTTTKTTSTNESVIELKKEILRAKRAFEEEKLCVVCQDAEKVMAFVPCGHKCACERCSVGLVACPLCRVPCDLKCRIYQ